VQFVRPCQKICPMCDFAGRSLAIWCESNTEYSNQECARPLLQRALPLRAAFSVWCAASGRRNLPPVCANNCRSEEKEYCTTRVSAHCVVPGPGIGGVALAAAGIANILLFSLRALSLESSRRASARGSARVWTVRPSVGFPHTRSVGKKTTQRGLRR
jgi:hypothetical protein